MPATTTQPNVSVRATKWPVLKYLPLCLLLTLPACVGQSAPEDNSEVTDLSYDPSVARPIEPDSMVGHALQMESALEQADFMMSDKKNYKDAVIATYTPKLRETGHVDGIKAAPKGVVMAASLDNTGASSSASMEVVGGDVHAITPNMHLSTRRSQSSRHRTAMRDTNPAPVASGLLRPGQ